MNTSEYIYIYIYTFVFLHVRPCAFFTRYCPTCEKTRKEHVADFFFFRKVHVPCNTNLQWRIIWLIKGRHTKNIFFLIFCVVPLNREKSPNWLAINVMASIASSEAYIFFWMECIMRCPEAFLRETVN